jgi:hypothetical protein
MYDLDTFFTRAGWVLVTLAWLYFAIVTATWLR